MKAIFDFFSGPGVLTIVGVLVGVNALLSAVKMIVVAIEPTPEKQAANPFLAIVGKVSSVLQSVIDFLSANQKH